VNRPTLSHKCFGKNIESACQISVSKTALFDSLRDSHFANPRIGFSCAVIVTYLARGAIFNERAGHNAGAIGRVLRGQIAEISFAR
jgi:hypothetical protein